MWRTEKLKGKQHSLSKLYIATKQTAGREKPKLWTLFIAVLKHPRHVEFPFLLVLHQIVRRWTHSILHSPHSTRWGMMFTKQDTRKSLSFLLKPTCVVDISPQYFTRVYVSKYDLWIMCTYLYIYIIIYTYIYNYIILICIHFVSKMDAPWDWNIYLAYTFLMDLKTIHVGVYSRFTERKGNLRQFKSFFCHPPCIYIYIQILDNSASQWPFLPSGKPT